MSRRRRRAQGWTDSRPRWNDPDLKCVRNYKMADGRRMTEVDPDYERRYREFMMTSPDQPNWRQDPTYNLRKR